MKMNNNVNVHRTTPSDLAHAGGEYHHLIDFAHLLQEVIHTRTLGDVHIVPKTLNLYWYNIIRMLKRLKVQRNVSKIAYNVRWNTYPKTAMNKGLVEVKDETFAPLVLG
jgi:hypothetical protein